MKVGKPFQSAAAKGAGYAAPLRPSQKFNKFAHAALPVNFVAAGLASNRNQLELSMPP